MSRVVKVGVIGYGYWGPNLVRNFNSLSNAELIAVADRSDDQLDRVRNAYPNITTVNDYREFFEMGIEAVAIATPPSSHHAIGIDCLQHGISTMIEKPMTLDSATSEDLIKVAKENNATLMVGHTFEYNTAIRMLKDIIDSGEIGDVLYIDAVRVNMAGFQARANAMWDLAPHDISTLLYLLGEEPESVMVQGVDSITKGLVDLAYMSLRFPSGVHGHIQVSWLSPRKVRQLTVVGTEKMIVFDDVEPVEKIKIYDKNVKSVAPYTETLQEFHWSYQHGDVRIPRINFKEPLRLETQEFIDSVISGEAPYTDGENGLRVVKVLEAGQESLDNDSQLIKIKQSTFA
ncbi:MAG: Gfo/Idh/MocA family oxidoreductase [Chloroflexota bacterium]